ncbi:MAG: lytic transglycosylase domain-containing protein [Paracoccaceae bacterium]
MPRSLLLLIALVTVPVFEAKAARDTKATMAICRNAAIQAADRHGIPRGVLIAITQVETGTRRDDTFGAWPWTVNVAGKGDWFDSRAAALLHAQRALSRGQTSFDVGCFQLNYRWHGTHFASIDEMFEPGPSGDYAARFLKSLHAETGDWIKAAGFYHSRTQRHAARYRNLVLNAVNRIGGKTQPAPEMAAAVPDRKAVSHRAAAPLWPLRQLGALAGPAASNGQAGGVALNALRRSRGALVIAQPRS